MGLSAKQIKALKRNLDHRHVRKRQAGGRELSYIEGWYALSEANRIFGFDKWNRETVESRCVLARENRGIFSAVYLAKVRITVFAGGATIIREGHGTGEGRGTSPGEVYDFALKGAETDATKRALATFGRPFGLELYRASKARVLRETDAPVPTQPQSPMPAVPEQRRGFHPDDTTPIPRPSRYYGRRNDPPLLEPGRNKAAQMPGATPPLVPETAVPNPGRIDTNQGHIDKSELPLGEPKRHRDKAHLKFVASQPCLICAREPSDPHHLRFAQPRAIGLKVSDEFTVPLCRGHHRQLHQATNEIAWWEANGIKPLPLARNFWEQTHPKIKLAADTADGPAKL